jgi:dinuclear metal center YbgI/SA1388 family protein
MVRAYEIINFIEFLAPLTLGSDNDNSGLQYGDKNKSILKLGISYEKDLKTIKKALDEKCDMLITHRPLYLPQRFPRKENRILNKIENLLKESEMVIYSAHENLDLAPDGIADTIAEKLKLKNIIRDGQLRVGETNTRFRDLIKFVNKCLKPQFILHIGNSKKIIKRVGVVPGTALDISDIEKCLKYKVDCYISGDTDDFGLRYGRDCNINLICIGDYPLEKPGLLKLKYKLHKKFPQLNIKFIEGLI